MKAIKLLILFFLFVISSNSIFSNEIVIYKTNYGYSKISFDNGISWEKLNSIDVIKISYLNGTNKKSIDNGLSWEQIDNIVQPVYYTNLFGDIKVSYDNGKSWTILMDNPSYSNVLVFPNPTYNNEVNLIFNSNDENLILSIFDLNGKIIKSYKIKTELGNNQLSIDLLNITQGYYILRLKGRQTEINGKIVIIN